MKTKKRKIKHFCRLYKYDCASCGKTRHRRHFAKQGETICPRCEKIAEVEKTQTSLFDITDTQNDQNN